MSCEILQLHNTLTLYMSKEGKDTQREQMCRLVNPRPLHHVHRGYKAANGVIYDGLTALHITDLITDVRTMHFSEKD